MSKRVALTLAGLTLMLAALVFVGPRLAIAYLRAEIEAAATADEEAAALCRANRWARSRYTPTYSVTCRDAADAEVRPWLDGAYDRVAVVTLHWRTGQSAERRLLSTRPLDCVFGE